MWLKAFKSYDISKIMSIFAAKYRYMTSKDFFKKFASKILWGNLLAMALVVVALCAGVKYGLDIYTHHGEAYAVPDLRGMDLDKARQLLAQDGISIAVSDTGRNCSLPSNSILLQTPENGVKVKSGRTVYVTINSLSSPMVTIPDIIDNSSFREAEAKLRGMGFTLLPPQFVDGEKDWVYGIVSKGRHLSAGESVPVDVPVALQVGSGSLDEDDEDVDVLEVDSGESDFDEFEIVTGPAGSVPSAEETTGE